jgi:hypothetical protein
VGVEPTILAAKDRINGFEGHEDHRTLFASRVQANEYYNSVSPKDFNALFLMGQFCACVAVLIRGRDYRGLAEVLQLFCAEIQLFGATVANFLRANSSSFGSVQTS